MNMILSGTSVYYLHIIKIHRIFHALYKMDAFFTLRKLVGKSKNLPK